MLNCVDGEATDQRGIGGTPTPGWTNFDNSLTIPLSKHPLLWKTLFHAGLLHESAKIYAQSIRDRNLQLVWIRNAARRIPLPDGSTSVVYSSHMLEHLDRAEARCFLSEAFRVLERGGVLRIAVPDLLRRARRYLEETKDADSFVASTRLAADKPHGLAASLKFLLVGPRHHHWMYDAASLVRLIESVRFHDAAEAPPGSTRIVDPGELNLREREEESIYLEALR